MSADLERTRELLREKAGEYRLQAAASGEHVPPEAAMPTPLFYAIQQAILEGIALALNEVAETIDEAA